LDGTRIFERDVQRRRQGVAFELVDDLGRLLHVLLELLQGLFFGCVVNACDQRIGQKLSL